MTLSKGSSIDIRDTIQPFLACSTTSVPVDNPTISYWQCPPSRLADFCSTPSLPLKTSTVIIGSGITGASIAYKLLKRDPSSDVLMLEARQACSGATGRNGGHCGAGRYINFADDCTKFGMTEAIRLARFEEQNCREVAALIKHEGIDCDFTELERVDLFFDTKLWEAAVLAVQMRAHALPHFKKGGLPPRTLCAAPEARATFKAPVVGAVTYRASSLSAYKLACRILELALQRGLNLQTNTPASAVLPVLGRNGEPTGKWTVITNRGSVIADKIILATNAYTGHLYPPLQGTIVPTRAQISAERPGSVFAGSDVPGRAYGIYCRNGIEDYMICRPPGSTGAGTIIIGGGRLSAPLEENSGVFDDSVAHPVVSKYLSDAPLRHFALQEWGKDSTEGRLIQEWTGIMGYTPDHEPIIGEAQEAKGLWICAGFNGHGMALAFLSAEALVRMVNGHSEQELDEWVPRQYRSSRAMVERSPPGF